MCNYLADAQNLLNFYTKIERSRLSFRIRRASLIILFALASWRRFKSWRLLRRRKERIQINMYVQFIGVVGPNKSGPPDRKRFLAHAPSPVRIAVHKVYWNHQNWRVRGWNTHRIYMRVVIIEVASIVVALALLRSFLTRVKPSGTSFVCYKTFCSNKYKH